MPDVGALLEKFRAGDRLALSRLLSCLARGECTAKVTAGLGRAARPARVVAITGSGGVGKSTTIGRLIGEIRKRGEKVAVLACDPQSPFSGGALLGDRFRMSAAADDGVFIRSLPAVSGRGAVADNLPSMTRLLEAFGFDVILVETVGAGQGDTAVADLADVVVLLLQPEAGDDLQWEKAGVLEVADVIAVQKADLPRAEHVAAQVRAAVELAAGPPVPVLLVSARTGQGVPQLWDAVRAAAPRTHTADDVFRELLQAAQETLAERLNAAGSADPLGRIAEQWRQGELTRHEAGSLVLELLAGGRR